MAKDYINIKNRKATFEYEITDKYVAGIALTGTEVKSIRNSKVSLAESYCFFKKEELFVKNMHIAEYPNGTHYNHHPTRERKLLLKRQELDKLKAKLNEKGLTMIVLRMFINDRGLVKLEIALAKGKKLHDKRHSIKDKDMKRQEARELKL